MKRIVTWGLASVFALAVSFGAFAANEALVVQLGSSNYGDVTQDGIDNAALSLQLGLANGASTVQSGEVNASIVSQRGAGNESSVVQDGFANDSLVLQRGLANLAAVTQLNVENSALVAQIGLQNDGVVYQDSELSGGVATLFQLGTANEGTIYQARRGLALPGFDSYAFTAQIGNANFALQVQAALEGVWHQTADIIQYGDRNEARQLQLNVGDIGGNHLDALQVGEDNYSQQVQSGTAGAASASWCRTAAAWRSADPACRRTQHEQPVAVAIIAQVVKRTRPNSIKRKRRHAGLAIQWGTDNFAQYS